MPISSNDVSGIVGAVWLATAIAAVVSALLSFLLFFAKDWLSRKTGLRLLSGVLVLVALGGLFACVLILENRLVYQFLGLPRKGPEIDGFSPTIVWVDPGRVHKVLPLGALLAAWLTAMFVKHRRNNRPSAAQ